MEVLIILLIFLAVTTVMGHVLWLMFAAIARSFTGSSESKFTAPIPDWHCHKCNADVPVGWKNCGACGSARDPNGRQQQLRDLSIAERLFLRLYTEAKVTADVFGAVKAAITAEQILLTVPVTEPRPAPSPRPVDPIESTIVPPIPSLASRTTVVTQPKTVQGPPKPQRPPRRSFSEVLNAFMEESNIRWGEIIGGLLIIGCSTALVVSLWAQISQIPVLKFLIFTTVTALLFGTGMYTDHRWKLPTTSRGILTIATLLVPLNFLAIAAVSSGDTSGLIVLGSELLAPAIFLCLVYFAGRVITPGCAHLLAAGILGSSVGQILVRHFATPEASPLTQVALGAFPVVCYLVSVVLTLRQVLADHEVDEKETTTVFTILGTMSFAALLPFGLLLYKSGPLAMSMMYLAPIVTLWGVPMLATGTVLWRRIHDKELIASRTAGTALAVLGLLVSLAGVLLAWPNPASIIPAAVMNVAILSILAVFLEIPAAHVLAACCFALAYHVLFQVLVGRIGWQNWRATSLVSASFDISTGWSLIGAFAIFTITSDWLARRNREKASIAYLVSSGLIAVISLYTITLFGPLQGSSLPNIWIAYAIYAAGSFWLALRRRLIFFTWCGAALSLFALASLFAWTLELSFPWQTALLVQASVCTVAAILLSRHLTLRSIAKSLNYAALISLALGVISFFQANPWQVTWMQTERLFWISGILLLSLWLNRRQVLLVALQVAVTATAILGVKATLQGFDWYTYLPHAFLHPAALQIQATVLALLSLIWIATRSWLRRTVTNDNHSLAGLWKLLDTKYSVDRIIPWILLGAFLLFTIYGAATGVALEFAHTGATFGGWNIASFPHKEALGFGSWVLLGLLALVMFANSWERRQHVPLLGAFVVLLTAIPLVAGRFEDQLATATALRFLATTILIGGSVAVWKRKEIYAQLKSFGWPTLDVDGEQLAFYVKVLLVSTTVVPVLLFTGYALLRTLVGEPVQVPIAGAFALLNPIVSYCFPLAVIALVLVGYAVRERLPQLNFYSALLFSLIAPVAYLFATITSTSPLDSVGLIRVLQLTAVSFAVHSLLWTNLRKNWLHRLESKAGEVDLLIRVEMLFAVALNILVIAPLALALMLKNYISNATLAAGDALAWISFALTSLALVVIQRSRGKRLSADTLASMLLGGVILVAFGLTNGGNSISICVATVGVAAIAWFMFAASYVTTSKRRNRFLLLFKIDHTWAATAIHWSTVLGGLAVFMSLRLVPIVKRPGLSWTLVPLVSMCALAACLQAKTFRRYYLYLAGIFFNIAAALWWLMFMNVFDSSFLDFSTVVASLAGLLWLFLELRARRLRPEAHGLVALSFHHVVAFSSLGLLTLLALLRFNEPLASTWWSWFAFGSVLSLVFAILWDGRAKYATAAIYALGLIGATMFFGQLNLSTEKLTWTALMFLSFYSLATTLLWHKRASLIEIARRIGIVPRVQPENTELVWLNVINVVAVWTMFAIVFWMDLSFTSFPMRLSAGLAIVAQSITFGLFAEGVWSDLWRKGSVVTFLIGAVLFGWAWLTPGMDATWLNRSVILMVEAVVFTSLYVLSLEQLKSLSEKWSNSIKACLPALLTAGWLALMFCLSTEVSYQLKFSAVNIHPVSLVAIGVALVGAIVAPVFFALSPTHDPLNLSEGGRMKYVYVSELMLSLLFLHVRLTMPWLFHGFFEDYWPLVLMVIAFAGVLASEALRRSKILVLAKPIERIGIFLPLLPVIGFWIATSQVDYSSLLFVVGALYGLVSILRKSFVFGVLAAVSGNAALWYILHRTADYQFFQHPQLWLVPLALSVLAACYLNEEKLSDDQMATMRYLSLVAIYASSTADIFINGVANSPWLPLILGGFSLAGVFSGIMLRIRGLLLMGSMFLLLSITTMIWYASANFGWTWLWYVAGIATGATIIFMFAVFEKKRSEVLRLVEGLKEWEV